MRIPYWQVEPEWAGETVAILGGGPSLTQSQVDACRGRCRVIAVNTAYRLAPWVDIVYFSDELWHQWKRDKKSFRRLACLKVALENARTHWSEPAVKILHNYGGEPGLCEIRDGVYTGRNSGYQAINLAAHLGVARVILLGFDMRAVAGRTHWHSGTDDAHQRGTAPEDFKNVMLPWFSTLVEPCKARGIEIVNCTPGSAIECFPRQRLETALAGGS